MRRPYAVMKLYRELGLFLTLSFVSIFAFQNCSAKFDSLENKNLLASGSASSLLNSGDSLISEDQTEFINFGVHTGGVSGGEPRIEGYLLATRDRSPWYIAQWKKIAPLRHNVDLKLGNGSDPLLFTLQNPSSLESSLKATRSGDGSVIYEIEGRQGYHTSVGGSNIFLAANVTDRRQATLDKDITFSFKSKLLEKKAQLRPSYSNNPNLLQSEVFGFYIGGFPLTYDDGVNRASLFIQFYIADTRINKSSDIFRYRGFYPHGDYMEIVATLPLSDLTSRTEDLKYSPDATNAPLSNVDISLNKLLCLALSGGSFNRTDGVQEAPRNFAQEKGGIYLNNLGAWSVGSVYLGFETSGVYFNEAVDSQYFYPPGHALYGAHDVKPEIKERLMRDEFFKGDTTLRAQISNLRMQAASAGRYQNCAEVLSGVRKEPAPQLCGPNSSTESGCPAIANGRSVKTCNSTGSAYGACAVTCNSGFTLSGGACLPSSSAPPPSPPVATCTYGAGINTSISEPFEWMCNCSSSDPIAAKPGWLSVGNSCYHRTADFFCAGGGSTGRKVFYVCDQTSQPGGVGWVSQPKNCYHWASSRDCN